MLTLKSNKLGAKEDTNAYKKIVVLYLGIICLYRKVQLKTVHMAKRMKCIQRFSLNYKERSAALQPGHSFLLPTLMPTRS